MLSEAVDALQDYWIVSDDHVTRLEQHDLKKLVTKFNP
jgi:hypothetical protein